MIQHGRLFGDHDAFWAGEPAAVGRVEEGLDWRALPCDEENEGGRRHRSSGGGGLE
jgi:hypothetical protein